MNNLTFKNNTLWGTYTPYCYIIIIKGIGYRAFIVKNDFINNIRFNNNLIIPTLNKVEYEFLFNIYLIIRAGHTTDLYIGLPNNTFCYTTKKDRKLVLVSKNKDDLGYLAKSISCYRRPSIYTGRGLRTKSTTIIRKAGKKDKQKGKAF